MTGSVVPLPALVLLAGPSGAGKSHWAARHFRPGEIVSSDALRAALGENEFDQDASRDAFELLDEIVVRRLRRGLTVVVDSLGIDPALRGRMLEAARAHQMRAVVVVFPTPPDLARERNRNRPVPVPAPTLTSQIRRFRQQRPVIDTEGWDLVLEVGEVAAVSDRPLEAVQALTTQPGGRSFGLVISRFPWPDAEIASRLREVAEAAEETGFTSMWVMDHLIQIPQVGRRWEPMLEGPTTLAWLAAITEGVTVGPLVANASLRHPAHLAKIFATIDVLSGGRARCGLGAGWWEDELVAYGSTLPAVAERLRRLEDALRLLPMMWGPGLTDFVGKTVTVTGAECYPRPLQERIPLMVGGQGRRTLELASRWADSVNLRGDVEKVKTAIDLVAALDTGRDTPLRFSHLSSPLVGLDRSQAADLRARFRGDPGTVGEHVGHIAVLAEAGVDEFYLAPGDLADGVAAIERLAPVLAVFV